MRARTRQESIERSGGPMFSTRTRTTPIDTSPLGRPRTDLRRTIGAVAAIATFVVAAGVTTAGADPVTESGCARWTAVLVPGTTETTATADPNQLVGLLAPIGEELRSRFGADIDVRSLPYSAAPLPYSASESGGVQALSSMLAGLCDSTQVVMAGYSQGADVAGDMASQIGNGRGPIPASRVLGVGLLSDPNRDPSTPQRGANCVDIKMLLQPILAAKWCDSMVNCWRVNIRIRALLRSLMIE
ncbi:cutinase family protein [Nocardia salmonicida]|uniref:cutinase family protein n=1 Tax=Nocardia salmonicida TaxID=53431 RepID=UPI003CEE9A04